MKQRWTPLLYMTAKNTCVSSGSIAKTWNTFRNVVNYESTSDRWQTEKSLSGTADVISPVHSGLLFWVLFSVRVQASQRRFLVLPYHFIEKGPRRAL